MTAPNKRNFLILFLLLFCQVNLLGQESFLETYRLRLAPITINEGLSQGYVPCIIQDSRGYMWFATKDGLNKYDGYKFTIYRHDSSDSTSIADNYVENIFEDSRGLLWIKTVARGMDIYDPQTETFSHLTGDTSNINLFFDFRDFSEDGAGNLWYKSKNGLCKITVTEDKNSQSNSRKYLYSVQAASEISNRISFVYNPASFFSFDFNGTMWLADRDSLYTLSKDALVNNGVIKRYNQSAFFKSDGSERNET